MDTVTDVLEVSYQYLPINRLGVVWLKFNSLSIFRIVTDFYIENTNTGIILGLVANE